MELNDYLSLIPPMNHDQPNFTAFLSAVLSQVADMDDLRQSLLTFFALDTATGEQLDILGRLTGASRTLPFEPATTDRVLSDTDFRLLIRATILRSRWPGTLDTYPALISTLFPDTAITVTDNMDMSVTITAPTTLSAAAKEMLSHGFLLPVPPGVAVTCTYV